MSSFIEQDVIDLIMGKESVLDDCSITPLASGIYQIITTDSTVENVHFKRDWISAYDLGFRALAVSLSDIAAMGGDPQEAFVNIALPETLDRSWIENFVRGITDLASEYDVYIKGGDTTRSERDIFLVTTVVGQVTESSLKKRSRAQPGDAVFVSRPIGDCRFAVDLLSSQKKPEVDIYRAFACPQPEVVKAKALARSEEVHAMMDLSDGLLLDAEKMALASSVQFAIDVDKLPISSALREGCQQLGLDPREYALLGGEDYALLFTGSPDLASQFDFVCEIGHVTSGEGIEVHTSNQPFQIQTQPFQHFCR